MRRRLAKLLFRREFERAYRIGVDDGIREMQEAVQICADQVHVLASIAKVPGVEDPA